MNLYNFHSESEKLKYFDFLYRKISNNGHFVSYDEYGRLHSFNDKPAKVLASGETHWYKDGKLHRDGDKPAVVEADKGIFRWYKDNKLHRGGDKPAIINKKLGLFWYKDGECHRGGDKPAIILLTGKIRYYTHDFPTKRDEISIEECKKLLYYYINQVEM